MFAQAAARIADAVLLTVPGGIIRLAGVEAMRWREVKGAEPTTEEQAHVLLQTLDAIAPGRPTTAAPKTTWPGYL